MINFSPESRKEQFNLLGLLSDYRRDIKRYVRPSKVMAALSVLAALESGCQPSHQDAPPPIERIADQPDQEAPSPTSDVVNTDLQANEMARQSEQGDNEEEIIKARKELLLIDEQISPISQEKIIEACRQVMPNNTEVTAINAMLEKKIICVLTEREVEDKAPTEEGIDFQAVLFNLESGEPEYITHFGADTKNSAEYAMKTDDKVRDTGLTTDELYQMLITYPQEKDNLVTIMENG